MAIRFPPVPLALVDNACYQYMVRTWHPTRESWSVDELFMQCDPDELRAVLEFQAGVQRHDVIKPTFKVQGTLPARIIEQVRNEFVVFGDLLRKMPKEAKCDAARLKDLLSYLTNFSQVQLYNLSASGITIVTADHPDREYDLDWVFSFSDMTSGYTSATEIMERGDE